MHMFDVTHLLDKNIELKIQSKFNGNKIHEMTINQNQTLHFINQRN